MSKQNAPKPLTILLVAYITFMLCIAGCVSVFGQDTCSNEETQLYYNSHEAYYAFHDHYKTLYNTEMLQIQDYLKHSAIAEYVVITPNDRVDYFMRYFWIKEHCSKVVATQDIEEYIFQYMVIKVCWKKYFVCYFYY